MSGHSARGEINTVRDFLNALNSRVLYLAINARDRATFGETELRLNFIEMLVHHKLDTKLRCALFARFGKEDHIAVELNVLPLKLEHHH